MKRFLFVTGLLLLISVTMVNAAIDGCDVTSGTGIDDCMTCNYLFKDYTSNWNWGSYSYYGTPGCMGTGGDVDYYSMPSDHCGTYAGLPGSGDCANYYQYGGTPVLDIDAHCPSYDRKGSGVVSSDCNCVGSDCGTFDYDSHFDFSNEYFAGPVILAGTLSVQMTLNQTSVGRNDVFEVEVNATCSSGACYNVTLQVDPETSGLNFMFLAVLMLSGIVGGFFYKRIKKSQTSTEYLIIVAVVIVIAVVVSSILGDFPGIGSGTTKKVDDYKLTTGKIAVDDYGSFTSGNYTLLKIRNNHFDTLVANKVVMNDAICTPQNITLNTGQSTTVNCSGTTTTTPNVQIIWTDPSTGASYSEGESSQTIVETSPPKSILGNTSVQPFYITNGPHTYDCGTVTDDSCVYTFIVNATGVADTYDFFAIATSNLTSVNSTTQVVTVS